MNRFDKITNRVAAGVGDDLAFQLSQVMWKTKEAIDKATDKALRVNNAEAMEMLERVQKPFYELIRFSGWQFVRYSDPWKHVSESSGVKLLNTANDTLKIVKQIVNTYGLR